MPYDGAVGSRTCHGASPQSGRDVQDAARHAPPCPRQPYRGQGRRFDARPHAGAQPVQRFGLQRAQPVHDGRVVDPTSVTWRQGRRCCAASASPKALCSLQGRPGSCCHCESPPGESAHCASPGPASAQCPRKCPAHGHPREPEPGQGLAQASRVAGHHPQLRRLALALWTCRLADVIPGGLGSWRRFLDVLTQGAWVMSVSWRSRLWPRWPG